MKVRNSIQKDSGVSKLGFEETLLHKTVSLAPPWDAGGSAAEKIAFPGHEATSHHFKVDTGENPADEILPGPECVSLAGFRDQ